MKNYIKRQSAKLVLLATVIAIAMPFAAHALVSYPPGSLLQPGDVATTTIRNFSVGASKIVSTDSFTFSGATIASSTITKENVASSTIGILQVTATTTLAATTTINGVTFAWPNAHGAANTSLTEDGSGNLSWANTTPQMLQYTIPASVAITDRQALYPVIAQVAGAVTRDTNGIATVNAGVNSQSITIGNNATGRILVVSIGAWAANTDTTNVQFAGQNMTAIDALGTSAGHLNTYYLLNPPIGAGNLTWSSNAAYINTVGWYSAYNVNQSSPIDFHAINTTPAGAAVSATGNTVAKGAFVIGFSFLYGNDTMTLSGNASANNQQSVKTTNSSGTSADGGAQATAGTAMTYTSTDSSSAGPFAAIVGLAPLNPYILAAGLASSASANAADLAFMGFARGAQAVVGSNVTIVVAGVLDGFSGLTAATQYYLNNTAGTIGTSAGTQTRKVGIALDSTHLLITNNW